MASHQYQQIPTTDDLPIPLPEYTPSPTIFAIHPQPQSQPQITSQYFTGLPTSAPPSFCSTSMGPVRCKDIPRVAGVEDQEEGEEHEEEDVERNGNGNNNEAIENILLKLMERVEVLERERMENGIRFGSGSADLEGGFGGKEDVTMIEETRKEMKRQDAMVTALVLCCGLVILVLTWSIVR